MIFILDHAPGYPEPYKFNTWGIEVVYLPLNAKSLIQLLDQGLIRTFKTLYTNCKDIHDTDNHYGVITHLEPDILECEVKWALGSITEQS